MSGEREHIAATDSMGIKGGKDSFIQGAEIGGNIGLEKSFTRQDKESRGESRAGTVQITHNELTDRIRTEVDSGLKGGLSSEEILKNINENIILK